MIVVYVPQPYPYMTPLLVGICLGVILSILVIGLQEGLAERAAMPLIRLRGRFQEWQLARYRRGVAGRSFRVVAAGPWTFYPEPRTGVEAPKKRRKSRVTA